MNIADATPVELDGITAAFALWRDRGVSAFDIAIPGSTSPVAPILDPAGAGVETTSIANPGIANPGIANPGIANPRGANPDDTNPQDGPLRVPNADDAPTGAMADDAGPIAIRFDDAAETFHGVYDPSSATITINRALTDRAALAIVIAHELGHVFGLAHVAAATRASLMNPGNLATPPTDADQRTLEALWGTCRGPARGR